MHRNFSFPLLHCYSAMDVLQMQMQHCNNYQNNQDLSLPSGSDILPIIDPAERVRYMICRLTSDISTKRVPTLIIMPGNTLFHLLPENPLIIHLPGPLSSRLSPLSLATSATTCCDEAGSASAGNLPKTMQPSPQAFYMLLICELTK